MTITLDAVTITRGGCNLIERVSFTAEPGAFTAICGPNGAGKSTALNVVAGSMKPDLGEARFDHAPVASIAPNRLALRLAVLPQSPGLGFPFLVHEVVAMGRAPHYGQATSAGDAAAIDGALACVQIEHMAERNYLTLSGGERQRVQIARVIAQLWSPPSDGAARWLLLDEPTSALDLKHQLRLMRLLSKLAAEGWGVLAVLHDISLIRQWRTKARPRTAARPGSSRCPSDPWRAPDRRQSGSRPLGCKLPGSLPSALSPPSCAAPGTWGNSCPCAASGCSGRSCPRAYPIAAIGSRSAGSPGPGCARHARRRTRRPPHSPYDRSPGSIASRSNSISRCAASRISSRRKSFDVLTRRHWRHGHISPSLLAITSGRRHWRTDA
jgi:iron complex transport system ATP-binding protein